MRTMRTTRLVRLRAVQVLVATSTAERGKAGWQRRFSALASTAARRRQELRSTTWRGHRRLVRAPWGATRGGCADASGLLPPPRCSRKKTTMTRTTTRMARLLRGPQLWYCGARSALRLPGLRRRRLRPSCGTAHFAASFNGVCKLRRGRSAIKRQTASTGDHDTTGLRKPETTADRDDNPTRKVMTTKPTPGRRLI